MKQRLVGAIVLACLALIFLPILLDGDGVDDTGITSNIPPPPPVPPVPDTAPQRPAVAADEAASPSPAPRGGDVGEPARPDGDDESAGQTASSAEPADAAPAVQTGLDQRGLPQAWSVRLASFAKPDNASRLVQRLRDQGYKGYSRELSSARGDLTAVFVGPVTSRDEADALQRRLEAEFNLSGLVVRFTIEPAQEPE